MSGKTVRCIAPFLVLATGFVSVQVSAVGSRSYGRSRSNVVTAGAAAIVGDDWHSEKTISGMAAEATGEAQTPDGPAKVRLSFECTPGKGGTDSVVFIVVGATKLKGFDFDDFEGPDAIASSKPLLTFTVHRTKGPDVVVNTNAAGSYTVTEGGFAFEASTEANMKGGKVTQLTDAIASGASSISIEVKDFKEPEKSIKASFPTNGAAEIISQTMKACSRH